MTKVAIDAQVVIQEQQAEIDWLRNRVLLQAQAIADLKAMPTEPEVPIADASASNG